MKESEFHVLADARFQKIEDAIEACGVDIDCDSSGGILTLTFENRSKIIINTQPPLHELWLAARAGGFHYRWQDGRWLDTRDGSEFFAALSTHASAQGGRSLQFAPPA